MHTSTITRPESIRVAVPAEALTEHEQDTLLMLAASHEKVATVPGRGEQRAWSRGGNVD